MKIKSLGSTWPVAEGRRGTGGSLQATARPDSQTGKQQSDEARGCPARSGQVDHRGSQGQKDPQLLKEMRHTFRNSLTCWDSLYCKMLKVVSLSVPLWRRWLGRAVVRSCKACWISCRVLNNGDTVTSVAKSWSLTPGALLWRRTRGKRKSDFSAN